MSPEADHDRGFFEQMTTCRDAYRRLADCIYETLALDGAPLALDLGAGLGHVAGRLRERGWETFASDLYAPEDMREPPAEMWRGARGGRWDLTRGPSFGVAYRHDVVICTETAEHIHAEHADTIVLNVAERAERFIVWSAAQPGQEWPGHVNLQGPLYWLVKFQRHNFQALPEVTAALRAEMRARHAQHEYAADNFFVLARRT
jgi:hypothetical protein